MVILRLDGFVVDGAGFPAEVCEVAVPMEAQRVLRRRVNISNAVRSQGPYDAGTSGRLGASTARSWAFLLCGPPCAAYVVLTTAPPSDESFVHYAEGAEPQSHCVREEYRPHHVDNTQSHTP